MIVDLIVVLIVLGLLLGCLILMPRRIARFFGRIFHHESKSHSAPDLSKAQFRESDYERKMRETVEGRWKAAEEAKEAEDHKIQNSPWVLEKKQELLRLIREWGKQMDLKIGFTSEPRWYWKRPDQYLGVSFTGSNGSFTKAFHGKLRRSFGSPELLFCVRLEHQGDVDRSNTFIPCITDLHSLHYAIQRKEFDEHWAAGSGW